jgi:NAD(P)-dependent dehydrogenase (short-subunit alcohol dehydrogenase family)
MKRVEGKVAIVTGAASGIGAATAALLAREGAKVAVADLDDVEGPSVVKRIAGAGGVAEFWHLDVTREPEVQRVFEQIHKRFGRIDILVNNAGIPGPSKPTHEFSEEEWDNVFTVDVKGVFFCTKHAISYLREARGGSIVNIGSIYAIVGGQDVPAYHAAKGAVRMMSKTDAMLYAPERIRVNSVHPGYIWTPLVERSGINLGRTSEQWRKEVGGLQPLGNLGEPDDIAYGVLYLASDESKYVTGTELVIDGGYTAR